MSRNSPRQRQQRAHGAETRGQADRRGVELARDLISENKRTRASFLDLGNCSLSEIPQEVAQFGWLTRLSLGTGWYSEGDDFHEYRATENTGEINRITDLTPISGLTGLRFIGLHGIPVSNLGPLSAMQNLRSLDISKSSVSDISALSGLVQLEILRAWKAPISDLAPVRNIHGLRLLSISITKVSDLTPLTGHRALSTLYAHSTPITDVTPLGTISTLQTVTVANSGVTDLSPLRRHISQGAAVRLGEDPSKTPGIYVDGCPLTVPPLEIVSQGSEAILNYFAERDADEIDHLYEAKLLILGEGGAGKTSLVRRLYQPDRPLPVEKESTRGIEIHRHEFDLKNGRRFRLNVWDFGGQEIYHATHQFFLTHRSLYLLLDDTRKDHKNVSDEGFKYWLDLIDVLGGRSPVLIFQNEKGGRSKAIDLAGIKGHYDNVKERYAGNLEDPRAADAVRDAIEFHAAHLGHVGEELPARWIAIRADVQARAAQTPYITQQDYFEIYRQHIDFDRTRALHLSRYLHDLGVFLHFQDDPLLTRTVILQNRWATEAVFRVLEDETVKANSGRFTATDCQRLWRDSEYAEMHPELLALMQRFELCYLLLDSTPPTWLAPQLLPPGKPAMLTDWARSDGSDLVLRYRYGFLPKGIISRLTVRMHHFVRDPNNAWTTGVLFERDNTFVLVELLPAGGEIELRARGPERKGLLTAIATNLDSLNASFPGLQDKIEKLIPCICSACRSLTIPHFFDQKKLLKRTTDHRLAVECPDSYEEVDVLALLNGIQQTELTRTSHAATVGTAPLTIRIFLASSAELRSDRDEFDRRVRRLNDRLVYERGVYLEVVRWEHYLDAMSATRLQDEYNTAVRGCDVFVSLYFTRTGKYTEEEFTAAFEQFTSTGRPFVYTYFKNAPINTGSLRGADITSLLEFKSRLSDLGHFPTDYANVDQLLGMFRDQLDEMFDRGL